MVSSRVFEADSSISFLIADFNFRIAFREQQLGSDFHQISLRVCDHGFIVSVSRNSWSADDPNAGLFHFLDQTIHLRARTNRNGDVSVAWGLLGRSHQFKA